MNTATQKARGKRAAVKYEIGRAVLIYKAVSAVKLVLGINYQKNCSENYSVAIDFFLI